MDGLTMPDNARSTHDTARKVSSRLPSGAGTVAIVGKIGAQAGGWLMSMRPPVSAGLGRPAVPRPLAGAKRACTNRYVGVPDTFLAPNLFHPCVGQLSREDQPRHTGRL